MTDHPYAGTLAALETIRAQWALELEKTTEPAHAAVLRQNLAELDKALDRLVAYDRFHLQEMKPSARRAHVASVLAELR
ncbi:hypothetical protein [Saccharopolyspora phatthalungensis]|uniref:Chromosomal replication initiation ATPase DnaA n=1 Tax=Saccharopolyspora phatthalungensis TaxID=664693 RepID=A0A840Q602_9PSEU|nr:hypothetical protein [Saccharopolyspora phatthalungensis]MBB5156054.1 chromosomal replication initiation ATPase DnaA [Saccharopolyspora phatthalungensis]